MAGAPDVSDMWPDGLDAIYGLHRAIDSDESDGGFLQLTRIRSSIVDREFGCVMGTRKRRLMWEAPLVSSSGFTSRSGPGSAAV